MTISFWGGGGGVAVFKSADSKIQLGSCPIGGWKFRLYIQIIGLGQESHADQ